jgi:hypothetical protein
MPAEFSYYITTPYSELDTSNLTNVYYIDYENMD